MITKEQIADAAIKARILFINANRLQPESEFVLHPESEFVSWDFFDKWEKAEELASNAQMELWELVDVYMKENPDHE